jgi:hypothetical protein
MTRSSASQSVAIENMKLEKLPVKEWKVQFYHDFIGVAAHLHGGGLYWTKYRLLDFPQDCIALNELKSVIVNVVDARAVKHI